MGINDLLRQRELDPEPAAESLFNEHCVTRPLVEQLRHTYTLHGHDGCVNTIKWNASGTFLASGSDDQHILIWREDGRLLRRLPTAHTNNVFSVLFIPHARDHLIVSAAGDSLVLLHDLETAKGSDSENEHRHIQRWECGGRVKKLVACGAEPRLFWSASEDGMLRQYDLRDNNAFDLLDMTAKYQLKSLATNESRPEQIAVGISDAMVPIYDRRNMKEPMIRLLPAHHNFGGEGRFLSTHLAFNQRGDELIVNIGSDNIYIFDVSDPDRHNSPDVLLNLRSFIHEDKGFQIEKHRKNNEQWNGTLSNGSSRQYTDFSEIGRLKDAKEFTRAIEKCSSALDVYWKSYIGRLSLLSPNSLDENLIGQIPNPDALVQYFVIRALCYFERNWEGDQLDSIRDCLRALSFCSKHKLAQSILIKSLIALKQIELAKECYELYEKLYPLDEYMAEVRHQLDGQNKEEGKYNPWTPEYAQRYRDYVDRFTGHLNINTDIKEANWFGPNDQFIVGGSDCGSMFIWERRTQNVVRVFKGDHYTVNCCQPHPNRCLIASSGIDNVIRFWEPASTALKAATESRFPEETEDRDITEQRYELMKRNRRTRTPELVWEQLLNSVGLGLFRVDSTHEAEATEEGEDEEHDEGPEGAQVIRCRQM